LNTGWADLGPEWTMPLSQVGKRILIDEFKGNFSAILGLRPALYVAEHSFKFFWLASRPFFWPAIGLLPDILDLNDSPRQEAAV
jgi:hypothetical protein